MANNNNNKFNGGLVIDTDLNNGILINIPSGSVSQAFAAPMANITKKANTNTDGTVFKDDYIHVYWDAAATNDLEFEVLTNPASEKVHVLVHDISAASLTAFDLNIASGQTVIDSSVGSDDMHHISVWAPSDIDYPMYRITVVSSNGTSYTNSPAYVAVEKGKAMGSV